MPVSSERPKIVVADGFALNPGDLQWSALERLGDVTVHARSGVNLYSHIKYADVVLTNKEVLDEALLSRLPRLRFISVMATGTNVVDLSAAERRGVVVSNVPAYASDSVAQHVFAMLLEWTNRISKNTQLAADGVWSNCGDFSTRVGPFDELAGKTLGVIGMGSIGQRVARIAAAFNMHVLAAHQSSMADLRLPHPVEWAPLDDVFRRADVLTLHCPLKPQTHNLVNARRLALMPRTAVLINTGRGPLIDESALQQALQDNRIGGACLDVLSQEPPPADHPLLRTARCLVTPHMAWASTAARQRLLTATVNNVAAFLSGSPINVVHP